MSPITKSRILLAEYKLNQFGRGQIIIVCDQSDYQIIADHFANKFTDVLIDIVHHQNQSIVHVKQHSILPMKSKEFIKKSQQEDNVNLSEKEICEMIAINKRLEVLNLEE